MAEITLAAARAVNRVLGDYPQAMKRLGRHAGKHCRFEVGPVRIGLRVTTAGLAEPVGMGADGEPDVAFTIPARSLPLLWRDREVAMRSATFTGDGEFAQLIAELARELRWDAEEDLSRIAGDIAAHRTMESARRFHAWRHESRARWLDNAAEYLTEERQAFVTQGEWESLTRNIEDLRDAVARLDARTQVVFQRLVR